MPNPDRDFFRRGRDEICQYLLSLFAACGVRPTPQASTLLGLTAAYLTDVCRHRETRRGRRAVADYLALVLVSLFRFQRRAVRHRVEFAHQLTVFGRYVLEDVCGCDRGLDDRRSRYAPHLFRAILAEDAPGLAVLLHKLYRLRRVSRFVPV